MVSSAEEPLRKAMAEARDAGMEKADLISMVADVYNAPQVNNAEPAPAAEVIYDDLPEGLIDVPTAVREYGISRSTLSTWRRQGKLHRRGRLRASAPGGGYNVFSREDVLRLISAPVNKGGRPKKREHTA